MAVAIWEMCRDRLWGVFFQLFPAVHCCHVIHSLDQLVFTESSGNEQRGFEGSIAALQCHSKVSRWRGEAETRVLHGDKGP